MAASAPKISGLELRPPVAVTRVNSCLLTALQLDCGSCNREKDHLSLTGVAVTSPCARHWPGCSTYYRRIRQHQKWWYEHTSCFLQHVMIGKVHAEGDNTLLPFSSVTLKRSRIPPSALVLICASTTSNCRLLKAPVSCISKLEWSGPVIVMTVAFGSKSLSKWTCSGSELRFDAGASGSSVAVATQTTAACKYRFDITNNTHSTKLLQQAGSFSAISAFCVCCVHCVYPRTLSRPAAP